MTRSNLYLGIDPGYADIGFALLKTRLSSGIEKIERIVDAGWISTPSTLDLKQRFAMLLSDVEQILGNYNIAAAFIEDVVFLKNIKLRTVSYSVGIVIAALIKRDTDFYFVNPRTVKKLIGAGAQASKRGVKDALLLRYQTLFSAKDFVGVKDELYDAIAVAIVGFEKYKLTQDLKERLRQSMFSPIQGDSNI